MSEQQSTQSYNDRAAQMGKEMWTRRADVIKVHPTYDNMPVPPSVATESAPVVDTKKKGVSKKVIGAFVAGVVVGGVAGQFIHFDKPTSPPLKPIVPEPTHVVDSTPTPKPMITSIATAIPIATLTPIPTEKPVLWETKVLEKGHFRWGDINIEVGKHFPTMNTEKKYKLDNALTAASLAQDPSITPSQAYNEEIGLIYPFPGNEVIDVFKGCVEENVSPILSVDCKDVEILTRPNLDKNFDKKGVVFDAAKRIDQGFK